MLRRVKEKLRTLGWADTLAFVAARMVSRFSFGAARLVKYYFVAQPVPSEPHALAGSVGSTRYYVALSEDAVLMQAPRPLAVYRDRFAQKARCVVAARGNELAGFIWLCPQTYREDDVRCNYSWAPAAIAEWDFDVYIDPQLRMGRLFARLWERAHAQLRTDGIVWTLSRVDAFNAESLAAHRKLGALTLGSGWFFIAGRLQLTLLTVAPYWHLSMNAANVPRPCFDLSVLAPPSVRPAAASS